MKYAKQMLMCHALLLTRLLQVKILKYFDHQNILKFYNWYETDNHYWIIFEYCTGGDLLSVVMQDQKLPEETVHDFGLDIVNGLQYVLVL